MIKDIIESFESFGASILVLVGVCTFFAILIYAVFGVVCVFS